jgi:CDP-paratose 2-epimerase
MERDRPVLIIGGAGFIGANLTGHLARRGVPVRILDDLSRGGARDNLELLRAEHGDLLDVRVADVRSRDQVQAAVKDVQAVFHFAAQVAVTTSIEDPRRDFDINARGTIEVLEAVRAQPAPPPLVYTSTNKVYGGLADVALELSPSASRWEPVAPHLAARGIGEDRPLAFHTPYGCSKGCADQYVLDYARIYALPATVFRMSCIYGPHQRGTEDQGWVAHFAIQALAGNTITIYGDGRQVRDVLFVDDLVDAFCRAVEQIDKVRGQPFNIGGGPDSTLSLLELMTLLERLNGRPVGARHASWRAGDQRYYVSNPSAFSEATGWRPRVSPRAGVEALHGWLVDRSRGGVRV